MQVIYTKRAQEDYNFWKKHNPLMLKKIEALLADIKKNSSTGLGKPEPLKFEKSGYWSRRINPEYRLVYKIFKQTIYIAQCRYHY